MPSLGIFLWGLERSAACSYYLLLLSFTQQIVFVIYGLYLDLLLTRVYVDVIRTNESKALCAWSEEDKACVNPEQSFTYIAIVSPTLQPQKIWAPSEYRWFFSCPKTHRCFFSPHDNGWFPAALMVQAPSGAYHKATLSWGGRLTFNSDFITHYHETPSSQSTE